jgi:hypothetical protein
LSSTGITPGAALVEKKSVRDLAANFAANKIGELLWRQPHLLSPSFRLTCMNIFMIFPFPFMHLFLHMKPKTCLVLEPKPRHSSNSRVSTDSISLLDNKRLSSGSSSSEHENGNSSSSKPEIAVRRIAGKKISALFEV